MAEGPFKKNYLNLFTFHPKCLKNIKRQRLRDVEFSKFENKPKTFEIFTKNIAGPLAIFQRPYHFLLSGWTGKRLDIQAQTSEVPFKLTFCAVGNKNTIDLDALSDLS